MSCNTATPAPTERKSATSSTRAQAEIYDVTEQRTAEDFIALADLLQPTMDEIDAIASNGGIARGVPTGYRDLDELTNGLQPGQMIVVAARPGIGKSTVAMDVLRSCSIKHGLPGIIFSLEMSKSEIVMRMLSAEAKIPLADMRSGRMSDQDWTRLAGRMSELSQAPLYIDDSPNLTMMEIRAQSPPAQTTRRPEPDRHRLPTTDEQLRSSLRITPTGSFRPESFDQTARKGA